MEYALEEYIYDSERMILYRNSLNKKRLIYYGNYIKLIFIMMKYMTGGYLH